MLEMHGGKSVNLLLRV